MRITLTSTQHDQLKDIPVKHRVLIYNADIIIEFLNATFIPSRYYVHGYFEGMVQFIDKDGKFLKEIPWQKHSIKQNTLSFEKLYEYYMMFRRTRPYTKDIESRFVFGTIIKHLNFAVNGWQFLRFRKGRKQVPCVAPLKLRVHATPEERAAFPVVPPTTIKESLVEFPDNRGSVEISDL